MDTNIFLLFFMLLTLFQGCLAYITQNIDCIIEFKCELNYSKEAHLSFPKTEIGLYGLFEFLSLIALCALEQLFKKSRFWIVYLLSSLLLLVNYIIIFGLCFVIVFQNTNVKCTKIKNCYQGKVIYFLQIGLLVLFQVLLTYIYLILNGKYKAIVQLFGKVGLSFRILLEIISLICIILANFYLLLEAYVLQIYLQSDDFKESVKIIKYSLGLCQQISKVIVFVYLLSIQIQEIYTTIGNKKTQYKLLNFFIVYSLCISIIFDKLYYLEIGQYHIHELFSNLYMIIQLNSYKNLHVQIMEEGVYNFSINNIYCQDCNLSITQNQKIIYLEGLKKIVHKQCYILKKQEETKKEIQQQLQSTIQLQNQQKNKLLQLCYMIDLQNYNKIQKKKDLSIYKLFLLYLFNWIIESFCFDEFEDYWTKIQVAVWVQFSVVYLLILFQNYQICFYLNIIGFASLNIFTVYCYHFYQSCMEKAQKHHYFQSYHWFWLCILYNIFINFIQAYQLSYIMKFERLSKRLHFIIFCVFILFDLQSFLFTIMKFQYFNMDWLFITFSIFNMVSISCYLRYRVIDLDIYYRSISKLFVLKMIIFTLFLVYYILFEYFSQISYFYVDRWLMNYNVNFIHLIINIQSIFFIMYLYCREAEELIRNQSIQFSDIELLFCPQINIDLIKCHRCQKQFNKGSVLIYYVECAHFIHKRCIKISWINYNWCCQKADNRKIEININ